MKLAVKLTLDGLVRARRTRAYDLADKRLARQAGKRRPRRDLPRGVNKDGRKP